MLSRSTSRRGGAMRRVLVVVAMLAAVLGGGATRGYATTDAVSAGGGLIQWGETYLNDPCETEFYWLQATLTLDVGGRLWAGGITQTPYWDNGVRLPCGSAGPGTVSRGRGARTQST